MLKQRIKNLQILSARQILAEFNQWTKKIPGYFSNIDKIIDETFKGKTSNIFWQNFGVQVKFFEASCLKFSLLTSQLKLGSLNEAFVAVEHE